MKEMDILPGYDSAWSCSTNKKGYAGTAVFFTKQAQAVTGNGKRDAEDDAAASQPVCQHLSVRFVTFSPHMETFYGKFCVIWQ